MGERAFGLWMDRFDPDPRLPVVFMDSLRERGRQAETG